MVCVGQCGLISPFRMMDCITCQNFFSFSFYPLNPLNPHHFSLLYHNINLFFKISLEVMQRKCHLEKHSAKMPCFSKQDILHPSAQLSTVLLIILKKIANHCLTFMINNTSENSGAGVFNPNTKHHFFLNTCLSL